MGKARQIKSPRVGRRFGKWKVVGPEIPGKRRIVPCECKCGNTKNVGVDTLVARRSTSCGKCVPKIKSDYPRIGKRFGKWRVIGRVQVAGGARMPCRCECGTKRLVRLDALKSRRSRTCGKCNRSMDRFKSVLGEPFGCLTVIKEHQICRNRRVVCRCDCGREDEFFLMNLKRGQVKSCGCKKSYNHTYGRIYYLIDPVTDVVRYVGQTVQQVGVRLAGHIYKGFTEQQQRTNLAKRAWINSLKPRRPIVVVAQDNVPVAKLNLAEQRHIARQRANGADLLNIQHARSVLRTCEKVRKAVRRHSAGR